jgi:hypothetical protein
MKKMLIVAFVISTALAACGGKKAAPTGPGPDTSGSAEAGSAEAGSAEAGSGEAGSAAPEGGGSAM